MFISPQAPATGIHLLYELAIPSKQSAITRVRSVSTIIYVTHRLWSDGTE
jgi:hypothetical protein